MKKNKIRIVFEFNGVKQTQVGYSGKTRDYGSDELITYFDDNASLVLGQFLSMKVSVYERKQMLFNFDVGFNDLLINAGKNVCFGVPHLYVFETTKKLPNQVVREKELLTEMDFEKRFYTDISFKEKTEKFVLKNFYVVFPKKMMDNYYCF